MSAVPQQGVVHGMDIEVYHGLQDSISKSGLDLVNRSPLHYYSAYLDPARPPPRKRAGQLEGSLAHCAVLEPEEFDKRYVVTPANAPRRPSAAQWAAKDPSPDSVYAMMWWTEYNKQLEGKTLITQEQHETAMCQADSIRALPEIAELLAHGRAETSAFWQDEATGAHCRCRPDWVAEFGDAGVAILDVKTCGDASVGEFARQCARKRYALQAFMYSHGYAVASGAEVHGLIFASVESEHPFAANALMLDERSLEQGKADLRRNLERYAECRRTGIWSGYGDHISIISLPEWAFFDKE